MKRVASLASVVGVQATGSIATLVSVMLIAKQRGAEIQGTFGLVKAEIDLLTALLLAGMPQAIFYFLNRGSLSWGTVRRLTACHAAIAAIAALGVGVCRQRLDPPLGTVGTVAVAAAVAALVAQGNLRGALLESRSSLEFSLVTALPGVCLLLGVSVILLAGGMGSRSIDVIAPVLASAYAAACVVTILIARRDATVSGAPARSPGIAMLGRYGVATWIPAVAQTLSPVIALNWINRQMGDQVGVGIFSAALMSLNLVLTPLAMLVPLLFKRWVGLHETGRWMELRRALLPMAVVCAVFSGVVLLLERPLVGSTFGPDYLTREGIFALLALGLWPQGVSRMLGVLFNADGRPWLGVVGEVARVAALVIGLLAFQVGSLMTLACVWIVAEFVPPVAGWLLVRYSIRRPGRTVA